MAVEFLDQQCQCAEAGAAHFICVGVEGGDGGVDGLEMAGISGLNRDAAFFPRREVGADVVFLNHQGEGMGGGLGAQDGGGDGGIDRVLGELVERADGGQAAEAGDEGVGLRGVGVGGENLDWRAQAVGGDGEAKLGQGGGAQVAAVAGKGFGVNLKGGDLGHDGPFAGSGE